MRCFCLTVYSTEYIGNLALLACAISLVQEKVSEMYATF